ncbi:hypothetical protein D0Z07_5628 [Hyphodiscus hymeniophilus]|uniref:Mucin n=1 Tax=Hyphodiscus hymeniophilus TaxID=353542 RepID=A0A9P6VHQ0_9HELO|nr:hypothetical protein D0Z07_5628 [Hyphodiscus hymeniophilus]
MAPSNPPAYAYANPNASDNASTTLQVPPLLPFYSYPILSSSTSDLHSTSDTPLSPRTLYAQSFDQRPSFTFDRPHSSQSLPSAGRFRKNMKNMTGFGTTDEEFEALPVAVRRKYFSTLERLRFAQSSRSNAFDEVRLPVQGNRKNSLADRRGLNVPVIEPRRKGPKSRRLRTLARQQSITSNEASWFLTLPDKIKKREFTREEQVILAGRLRQSVILDAADEAIYKSNRRASRNQTPLLDPSTPISTRTSTDSYRSRRDSSDMADAMYESFRWMDEEEDINLKLVLDDYHANLDGYVFPTSNSNRRPSFRRTMSITKKPFGRNSLSSIQPRSPKFEPIPSHSRQKSRTLSLIGPKHVLHDSISSIDPNATHYQDPEARLKLRVYLASPQKFDEAIEFGFPSMEGVTGPDKENKAPTRISRDNTGRTSHATDRAQSSFLDDDAASALDDDASMGDPDSPLTPIGIDLGLRSRGVSPTYVKGNKASSDFSHLVLKPTLVKQHESYAHSMAGSREMTLRMTLTRRDLRADESTIYGWQTAATKSPLREEPLAPEDMEEKYEVRGPLGGVDGWEPEKENGVVKRFWNKVKSQRKS